MTRSIRYTFDQDIPVIQDVDVAVIGGGPGGIGAAVMAAREGASTVLIERYGFLGGMAASGEVHPFMPNHAGDTCLDRPVHLEWARAMRNYLAGPATEVESDEFRSQRDRMISKDAAMLAAEDLCLQAGTQLLYHHWLADVIRDGETITHAVLLSKSGYSAVAAKAFVDCTGDGDLAAVAGCEFGQGGPSGHSQPMTLCFKLAGIDPDRMPPGGEITELYHQARERGEIDCVRENVLMFGWIEPTVMHFNTTRVCHKSGTSGVELSEAEIDARRQVREYLRFFRDHVPGFENAWIYSIAHHIGVRESRRIRGLAEVTKDDFIACRKYPDAIARVRYNIDIHNPDGTGTEHLRLPEGEWYEIPYGCIVAKDAANLLVGGRPISVDHAVHSSMRVMPPACSVGQAAGLAAARVASTGKAPRDLDGEQIRDALKERGAYL